ncbi:hypothetical protein KAR91_81770 [Candidatus Pacearchaeota archaeon]|nr:hypothetical protein [Candidatus Pacearchaeota archaeon]
MIKKLLKSKTIDFNIVAAALVKVLSAFGVAIPIDVILAGFVIMNFILRLLTTTSISKK